MVAEKSALWLIFQGDTMRLDFVNECQRSETKALVGIEEPWVQSPRVNNKKLPMIGEFFELVIY